jgi:hypothetical protein
MNMNAIDREGLLKWLRSLDSTYVTKEIIPQIESGAFDIKQPEVPDLYVDLLDKLIEGLRWYADKTNYVQEVHHLRHGTLIGPAEAIYYDEGQRARDILKEVGVTVE